MINVQNTTTQLNSPYPSRRNNNRLIIILASIVFVLLILLVSLVLVILYGNRQPTTQTQNPKITTINFWTRREYINKEALNEMIRDFESQNPGIKINHEYQSDTRYKEKIVTRLKNQTGELGDIIEIEEQWLQEIYSHVLEINDRQILDRYTNTQIQNNTILGSVKAVPYQFDALFLAYNQDHLNSIGLTEKELNKLDWTNLALTAQKLTKYEKITIHRQEYQKVVKAGIAVGSPSTVTNAKEILKLLLIQNNVNIYNKGLEKYEIDEKLNAVFEFYFGFTKSNIWSEEFDNDIEAFANEKVSMIFVRSKDIDKIIQLNPKLNFKVTITPKVSILKNVSLSKSLIIPKSSPNYNEAIKFIEFITRPNNSRKLFEKKSDYTFIPAQFEALKYIPSDSPFAVFSDASTIAEKLECHNNDEIDIYIDNYLSKIYATIKDNKEQIRYNVKEFIEGLNNLIQNKTLKVSLKNKSKKLQYG